MDAAAAMGGQARMARYNEQLREVSVALGIDSQQPRRRSLSGSPGTEEASQMDNLIGALKRSKWSFSDADMKGSLIKGCFESAQPWGAVDESRADLWQEAKRRNKELKGLRKDEQDVHKQLHKQIAEAFDEAREAYGTGKRELEMLRSQEDLSEMGQHMGEGEDLDLCPSWENGPHSEAAEDSRIRTDELASVVSARQQEAQKKAGLEAELMQLEHELKQAKARSTTSQQQHKQAAECADSLEKINQAHLQLGFPQITFHEVDAGKSDVVLGDDSAGVDQALRTVRIEVGKDGELTRALPHPALVLQHEASEAVKRDDLPYLLTLAWHRICDTSARPERTGRPTRGGC